MNLAVFEMVKYHAQAYGPRYNITMVELGRLKAVAAKDSKIKEKQKLGIYQYKILEGKCIGCTACARMCPDQCITGEVRKLHVIDQQRCTVCGQCKDICKFDAIVAT